MSQENVELWRETVEGFLRGSDESEWEPWLTNVVEILDPSIEVAFRAFARSASERRGWDSNPRGS